MKPKKNIWTPEQDKLAVELLGKKLSDKEFFDTLGRTKGAAWKRIRYIKKLRNTSPSMRKSLFPETTSSRPTKEMLEDAKNRKEARDRRSPTAAFFGDPPPGYTAFDDKEKKQCNTA